MVVRKDFVGVVAETQYQARSWPRVGWRFAGIRVRNSRLRATFFEHLQKQPSHDALSVDSGDVDQNSTACPTSCARGMSIRTRCMARSAPRAQSQMCGRDQATVWSATQSVYPTRSIVAKLLDMPLENVRVIYVRGSGCYGLNGADAVSFDAALLSHAAGRPVRLQFSRQDEMMWENLGAAWSSNIVRRWIETAVSRPGIARTGSPRWATGPAMTSPGT